MVGVKNGDMPGAVAAQGSLTSAQNQGSAANNAAELSASAEPASNNADKGNIGENIPLAALLGTAPMDESEILPPSILQNMNLWMNDSLLTAAAAAGIPGFNSVPAQPGLTNSILPPSLPTATVSTQAANTAAQPSQGLQTASESNGLFPMDFALGLPAMAGQLNPATNNTFSSPPGSIDYGSLAGLGPIPASRRMEQTSAFLQSLSQQFNQIQTTAALTNSFPSTNTHSPLSASSPNPLLGSADVGTFTPFPTSAFASLNLVNSLDALSQTQAPAGALGANNGLAGISASVGIPSGSMQPVPTPTSAALALDSAIQSFRQKQLPLGDTTPGEILRHNTFPVSQERRLSFTTASTVTVSNPSSSHMPLNAEDNALANNANMHTPGNLVMFNTPQSLASSAAPTVSVQTPVLQQVPALTSNSLKRPSSGTDLLMTALASASATAEKASSDVLSPLAATEPLQLSIDINGTVKTPETSQTNSPWQPKEHRLISPNSIAQMNNDSIPQMLQDAVAEHPELGSAELVYNLLITHVVHDCSRIGMYNAHLFWMRVKQYKLPKFHLFASIADASRSWTLSEELRMALPPNLDETCYALSIQTAPTDVTNPNVLSAVGLLVLAAYEFKSARFAPMVEHSCLAYKIMIHIKFRNSPFPWRGAKKRPGPEDVDSNYQLLIRAFWRLSMALYYSTEIFRLDAPDDREFLPEIPTHDEFFIRHVFVPEESEEFGFRAVLPPYEVHDTGKGDLFNIICELVIKQYKISNRFNRVLRGEKTTMWYINYLIEWDRQMLEWRDNLPAYLHDDLDNLARQTQPLDARRRRINLWGLSENEMWQKRHEWNQDVGYTMEVLYVHMMFEMARIKAYRIGLMMLLHEDLDMVRNFQHSKAFTIQELPRLAHKSPITGTYEEDRDLFHYFAEAASKAASHVYDMLKFNQQFGLDLHAYGTTIISTLLQVSLVYVGQVQSRDVRLAWHAMLRLARILAMIRSLDRWGPALYIFTNILKALGRPELILQVPSPETRAQLAADTRKPAVTQDRSGSVDSTGTGESTTCMESCCRSPNSSASTVPADNDTAGSRMNSSKGKRKNICADEHGDEKRYEFSDHHHGDPQSVSSATGSPISDEDDVTNPFPSDHVISHIMREQKVSTATFFSPTLPILAASLLHTNSS
ncbi:hypothetical protein IWW36_001874 [Coemansia brasiliensis]|uniref:Transcription factor domain-containing protein n=1 Tax=Coemansia brasiliensis TaxID=2650707 RepID=A0A9W8LZY7_9FUNG|nr:hypothetical protein IWW36_001874 [Coemansia brasiliensis]